MIDLTKFIPEAVLKLPDHRFRDRRAFYASSALADMRDEYWRWTKEPETNPTDFLSKIRMLCGDGIETAIKQKWISKFHIFGLHLLADQVPVGGSDPIAWDGYCDWMLAKRDKDGKFTKFLVEVKTKWGFGAKLLWDNPRPKDIENYFLQLGLYLKDLHEKGKGCEGALFFVLISDDYGNDGVPIFGQLLQFDCRYDPSTEEVECYAIKKSTGEDELLAKPFRTSIKKVLKSWADLKKHIEKKELPQSQYQYKYPVTKAYLKGLSDYQIRRVLKGGVILGDWQPHYSAYKNKILELDEIDSEYTPDEMLMFEQEYKMRHPKSKVGSK